MKRKLSKFIYSALVFCLILCSCISYSSTKELNHWISVWNVSTTNFTRLKSFGLFNYNNQTIRTIVTSSFSGTKERIKFSNEYGTEPLSIGAVSVSLVNFDGTLKNETNKSLTFNGKKAVTVKKGAFVWSDPVEINIKALDKIAVSTYFPKGIKEVTGGCGGVETYLSQKGNHIKSSNTRKDFKLIVMSGFPNICPFLSSIEVSTSQSNSSILTFGDSITTLSWPEYFVKELKDNNINNLSVFREAIAGNRILHDTVSGMMGIFGVSGASRFEKAITNHEGVEYIIVLEGINDIMSTGPGGTSPASEFTSEDQIIEGLQRYIDIAHKHKLKIYGATIMPFKGYTTYTDEEESRRQAVNNWIRNSGRFDAVIDFEKATSDSEDPAKLKSQYDSGDHIHPNDAGGEAIAKSIDLKLFK